MTKDIYKLELIYIFGALLIGGLSIFAIFSAPSSKYVKLIKWSDVDTIDLVFESTIKRLYPQLSEANHIRIENYEPLTTLPHISAAINKITGLESRAVTQPDLIVLNNLKKNDIQLKIIYEKKPLESIDTKNIFDEKSFMKVLNKKQKGEEIKNFLFSLYQVKSNEYILNLYSL